MLEAERADAFPAPPRIGAPADSRSPRYMCSISPRSTSGSQLSECRGPSLREALRDGANGKAIQSPRPGVLRPAYPLREILRRRSKILRQRLVSNIRARTCEYWSSCTSRRGASPRTARDPGHAGWGVVWRGSKLSVAANRSLVWPPTAVSTAWPTNAFWKKRISSTPCVHATRGHCGSGWKRMRFSLPARSDVRKAKGELPSQERFSGPSPARKGLRAQGIGGELGGAGAQSVGAGQAAQARSSGRIPARRTPGGLARNRKQTLKNRGTQILTEDPRRES